MHASPGLPADAPKKVKVTHVSLGLNVGGMEKLLVDFARFADRSRFELHFCALQERGKLADPISQMGWNVTALDKRDGFRPSCVVKLAKCLRKSGTNVIHAHNTAALSYAVPAALLAGIKRIIITRHGRRFGASRNARRLFRWLARRVNYVVCVSKDVARQTLAEGVSADQICAIHNGVDLDHFTYVGPQPAGPVVLVARLSPEKDLPTLLKAARIAVQMAPEFRLQIAGGGALLEPLMQQAQELGLQNTVQFLGETNDVPAVLSQACCSVLSSTTEGVSLTLLEAMARGLPVVATSVGGNPEVVADGVTGLLVPPQNPEKLAAALVQIQRNADLGRRLGEAGRRRVEASFCVRQMVRAYETLYLGEPPPDVPQLVIRPGELRDHPPLEGAAAQDSRTGSDSPSGTHPGAESPLPASKK